MINVFLIDGSNEQIKKVARALRLSKHKNIKIWIERSMVDLPPYNTWKDKNVIDDKTGSLSNLYFEWNIRNQTVSELSYEMRCLWWRIKNQGLEFCVIMPMSLPKERLILFEDSLYDISLPINFESLCCFSDYDSLINYCKKRGEVKFSLNDECFFKHEHDIPNVKGAEVFRESATGRLWYFDTFHKDHYEVFDKRGREHLGEADLRGVLDPSKADPNKHAINR